MDKPLEITYEELCEYRDSLPESPRLKKSKRYLAAMKKIEDDKLELF